MIWLDILSKTDYVQEGRCRTPLIEIIFQNTTKLKDLLNREKNLQYKSSE